MAYRLALVLPIAFLVNLLLSFNLPAQVSDPCWALTIDDIDVTPASKKISKIVKLSDGIIVCGTASNYILPSKNSNSFGRTNFSGPYLVKYDFNGNLIWADYGIDSQYFNPYSTISGVTTDANENIYITGTFPSKYKFYYNNGLSYARISAIDTAAITASGYNNFIAKLDKQGKIVWHASLNSSPNFIEYDHHGRIIVAGEIQNSANKYVLNKDTTTALTVNLSAPLPPTCMFVYWIDTLGTIKKAASLNNVGNLLKLATNKTGDVILGGKYNTAIKAYSHAKSDSMTIYSLPSGFSSMYIMKFDSSSKPLWSIRDHDSHITDLQSVTDGSIYFTTYTSKSYPPHYVNSDSSIAQPIYSLMRLYSITSDGKYKWSAGGEFTNHNLSGLHATDSDIAIITSNTDTYKQNDTVFGKNKGTYIDIPHLTPNLCIAYFDTSGDVKHAVRLGRSALPKDYRNKLDIIGGNDSSYIIYGEAYNMFADSAISYHDDTVNFNQSDPYIIKSTKGICETINPPLGRGKIVLHASTIDSIMCALDSFFLPFTITGEFWANTECTIRLGSATSGTFKGISPTSIYCGVPNYINLPRYNNKFFVSLVNPTFQLEPSVENIDIFKPDTPSITISVHPSTVINEGTSVTFAAITNNVGGNVLYQWQLNGLDIPGANKDTYSTTTIKSNDVISIWTYSSYKCIYPDTARSGPVHMLTTSIANNKSNNTDQLYPNPNNGSFYLNTTESIDDEMQIQITDLKGRIVSTSITSINRKSLKIELIDISNGLYILKVISKKETKSYKFSVVK